jgi:hypothetical protein
MEVDALRVLRVEEKSVGVSFCCPRHHPDENATIGISLG